MKSIHICLARKLKVLIVVLQTFVQKVPCMTLPLSQKPAIYSSLRIRENSRFVCHPTLLMVAERVCELKGPDKRGRDPIVGTPYPPDRVARFRSTQSVHSGRFSINFKVCNSECKSAPRSPRRILARTRFARYSEFSGASVCAER